MKKQNVTKKDTNFGGLIFLGLFSFLYRLFIRMFFVPFYVAMLAPWVIIIVSTNDTNLISYLFNSIAFLAGNSGAESLDEGDLARAGIVMFIALDVLYEVIQLVRGKSASPSMEKQRLKTHFIIKSAATFVGWTIVGIIMRKPDDVLYLLVPIAFGVCFTAFFWMEYSIKLIFSDGSIKKMFPDLTISFKK